MASGGPWKVYEAGRFLGNTFVWDFAGGSLRSHISSHCNFWSWRQKGAGAAAIPPGCVCSSSAVLWLSELLATSSGETCRILHSRAHVCIAKRNGRLHFFSSWHHRNNNRSSSTLECSLMLINHKVFICTSNLTLCLGWVFPSKNDTGCLRTHLPTSTASQDMSASHPRAPLRAWGPFPTALARKGKWWRGRNSKFPIEDLSREWRWCLTKAFIYTNGASIMGRLLRRGGWGSYKADFRKNTTTDNSVLWAAKLSNWNSKSCAVIASITCSPDKCVILSLRACSGCILRDIPECSYSSWVFLSSRAGSWRARFLIIFCPYF